MDYENMGVLERINGLLFGRPYGYTEEEKRKLRALAEDLHLQGLAQDFHIL